MPRGIFNWTFSDVDNFLKQKKFRLAYTNGSHYYYVGNINNSLKQVCVPFHGKVAIKPRTMSGIIRQSGIDKKDWLGK